MYLFKYVKSIRREDIVTIFIIPLFVFVFQSMLAAIWSSYGVFDQYNMIFDADANAWKSNFANGRSVGGFTHPLLLYFVPREQRAKTHQIPWHGHISPRHAARGPSGLA